MTTPTQILELIGQHEVEFVDLRYTDTLGQENLMTIPARHLDEEYFESGHAFDGSSIPGWKGVEASDMLLLPDAGSARLDPFREEKTLVLVCDVLDPVDLKGYERAPRSVAKRAESYLKSTGIGDTAFFGPEPEFFVFDGVSWNNQAHHCSFKINSEQGSWMSGDELDGRNNGFRPRHLAGYAPLSPADAFADFRSEACLLLEEQGVPVEVHHSEVATAQLEIGTRFGTLVQRADWNQIMKYTINNLAHIYGKTATFMPKPLFGNNGSGMHVHQSIWKDGHNLFSGNGYAGLSETALFYIGGIIKHARALNAICNPGTNSYKRLVPHFEAPVKLAYSARNRSASIRIPYVSSPNGRRVEVRFPDPLANPYLCFSALLMAGLDGIQNRIHPGDPADKNLYDLPPEEDKKVPTVAESLEQALEALDRDRDFLLAGDVFTDDLIDAYIELKTKEVNRLRTAPHPIEFEMYY